jgi:hypothetical protein
VQTTRFSLPLYFPHTDFRCLSLFPVSFFQDGKMRPNGQVPDTPDPGETIPAAKQPDSQETLTVAQTKTATKTSSKKMTSSRSLKKSAARPAIEAGHEVVTIDRRRSKERRDEEAKVEATPVAAPKLERREKVSRRRQIDPTTCERDYTDQEVEFMNALDDYKRKSGRMFPTCSEVLEVINTLGYVKVSPAGGCSAAAVPASAKPMPAEASEFSTSQD